MTSMHWVEYTVCVCRNSCRQAGSCLYRGCPGGSRRLAHFRVACVSPLARAALL